MKNVMPGIVFAIVSLFAGQALPANGDPAPIHVFCSNFFDVPSDEGFFRSGTFCYQIEVSCEGDVSGGFLWGELNPEGNVYGHMESVAGPPQPVGPHVPSCVLDWFVHWNNSKFEHSCSYRDFGKFKLKAKLAPFKKCVSD